MPTSELLDQEVEIDEACQGHDEVHSEALSEMLFDSEGECLASHTEDLGQSSVQPAVLLDDIPTAALYEEGLEGIASIVAFRFRDQFPELQASAEETTCTNLPPWVEHFSKKGRSNPKSSFIHKVKLLDSVFLTIHGMGINREFGILDKFVKQSQLVGCKLPLQVIRAVGKLRLDIRMRCLNMRKDKTKDAVLLVNAEAKRDKNKRANRVNRRWMR